MDNLTPHKCNQTLALITQAGAEILFLPAYSPDLNRIEKMWSTVKTCLSSAGARTQETLITAIGRALQTITPQDTINWFASCDTEHYHSGIDYVTPQQAHDGQRQIIVEQRRTKKLAQRRRRRVENQKPKTGPRKTNKTTTMPADPVV
jgi:hypothetical protein